MIKTMKKSSKQISSLNFEIEIINPIESKSLFGGGWYEQLNNVNVGGYSSYGYGADYQLSSGMYNYDWHNNGDGGGGGTSGSGSSWIDNNEDGINDANQTQDPPEWSLTDFFDHYNNGNGQPVNLNDMGLRDDVISSDVYLQLMTNVNNQIEDLVHAQVAQGNNQPGTYQFTWDFNNSYDFTLAEGLFAIGSATINGQFSGEFTLDVNCNINVTGLLNLNFHDSFEDPWDLINAIPGSWDPSGTPYSIDDNWQQEILMQNIKP
jgi:hypothetical protein